MGEDEGRIFYRKNMRGRRSVRRDGDKEETWETMETWEKRWGQVESVGK